MPCNRRNLIGIIIVVSGTWFGNLAKGSVFLLSQNNEILEVSDFSLDNDLRSLKNSSVLASVAPTAEEEPIDMPTAWGNSFLPSPVAGTLSGNEILKYEVQLGDTPSAIAARFGISVDSLLWSNGLQGEDNIYPGQELTLPPINGVVYKVQRGDTVSSLALKFSVSSQDIIDFNLLEESSDLHISDILIIPDGKVRKETPVKHLAKNLPQLDDYFVRPTSGRISQGLHPHNAIDVANSCGTLIYSAAPGIIEAAKTSGWNGGAGNYIKIKHPNGTYTLYAHLGDVYVQTGDQVERGAKIGLMSYTGRTVPKGPTGCHLHFSVYGAKNPLAA